jgi:hypothetical protein
MKSIAYIVMMFLSIIISITSYAQKTQEIVETEGVTIVKNDSSMLNHSPKKAGYLSTALPGLGQIYNKKYWKVPIIYVGFGTLTYFIIDNNKNYQKYLEAYKMRIDNDPNNDDILPEYTTENLRVIKNLYWKNRDLMILLTVGLYALNILDAVVDAHFFTYDISDDLSFHISPTFEPNMGYSNSSTAALSFSLNF